MVASTEKLWDRRKKMKGNSIFTNNSLQYTSADPMFLFLFNLIFDFIWNTIVTMLRNRIFRVLVN